jgi:hypothetical protein
MTCMPVKWILQRCAGWAAWAGLSLFCVCSPSMISNDGGGSRGGNPVVIGTIAGQDGAGARNVRVSLIAKDYNSMTDAPLQPSSIDTTDSLGSFLISAPDTGWYNVEAVGILSGERLIRFNVKAVNNSMRVLPVDTLRKPGAIKVPIPEGSDAANGYVYVPGTSIGAWFAGAQDTVELDSVPAGTLPVLYYAQRTGAERKAIGHDILVHSDETTVIGNPEWSYYRRIFLNTSPSGASVSGDVYGFPVIIRLNSGNFDFTQARNDGGDLKFAGSGNKSLPFEIERWDSAARKAEIWVKVDTVHGNDSTQFFMMYWGNPAATTESNSAAVFDTANGFQGVWHLSGAGASTAYDATGNHYDGTPENMTAASMVPGAIGSARQFDGSSQYITMLNTASGNLNMPQNSNYSMSLWAYADTIDTMWHVIAGKGHEQFYLKFKCFGKNRATWEFVEFQDGIGWDYTEDSVPPAPGGKQWVYITGIREGSQQRLYINGTLVSSAVKLMGGNFTRNTYDDFMIGRHARLVTIPYYEGLCFFGGKVDEVRVSNAALSSDWIKLSYMNQRADDKLVLFKNSF